MFLICDKCGAQAELKNKNRFFKRHPALCTKRRELAKQLAQTTRCVDSEESKSGLISEINGLNIKLTR